MTRRCRKLTPSCPSPLQRTLTPRAPRCHPAQPLERVTPLLPLSAMQPKPSVGPSPGSCRSRALRRLTVEGRAPPSPRGSAGAHSSSHAAAGVPSLAHHLRTRFSSDPHAAGEEAAAQAQRASGSGTGSFSHSARERRSPGSKLAGRRPGPGSHRWPAPPSPSQRGGLQLPPTPSWPTRGAQDWRPRAPPGAVSRARLHRPPGPRPGRSCLPGPSSIVVFAET